jgi:hypothetical protein
LTLGGLFVSVPRIAMSLHDVVLHLPILTTVVAVVFAIELFSRYRSKGGGPHLLWWGIGMVTYAMGTTTEALTTLFGWNPLVFRLWYITGAFLGGYPLAQGSIYLLTNRRFANVSAAFWTSVIVIGAVLVFLSPLDLSAAEVHRPSGKVLGWSWIRLITPFINIYSLVFLMGGAIVSAWRFRREPALRDRYAGNILIAIGALLPAIGGSFTRAGFVEVLYVTELVGLVLIYLGYRRCVKAPRPVEAAASAVPSRA